MATIPGATTTVVETAVAVASGLDTICVFSPVPDNADYIPRLYGNATAVHAYHGYCPGVEYVALHAQFTRKNFLFCGLPIATAGAVGREDTSGNTGTSVTTVAAGGDGVLFEHDGEVTVVTGGTIGTSQIVLDVSADGGTSTKRVRLGVANSYAIPHLGVTISFLAGTLVAGDMIHSWHGSGPRSNAAAWALARAKLADQQRGFRSIMLSQDLVNNTEAAAYLAQIKAYKTENDRSVYGRASLLDRLPLAELSTTAVAMTGSPNITFAEVGATGDTITRSAGSFVTDGFVAGQIITIAGSVSNDMTTAVAIATVTALVITLDTDDLVDEGPVAGVTITGATTVTFAEVGATGDTITRSAGSWLADGFRVGDVLTIADSASNDATHSSGVTDVTATVITLDDDDLAAELIRADTVSIAAGQTKAVWIAALDAAITVDAERRIDLSVGRGRFASPFTAWNFRYPAGWAASLREYSHDLHISTWQKDHGPTGFDLYDSDGALAEYDDRVDGAAATAARFTSFRSWANGPRGAFIARSLTRASDSSLLVNTSNCAVVNLVENLVQAATENFIGRSIVLNDDGTATTAELAVLEKEVNAALKISVLADLKGEGPRASKAVWTASTSDVLNVAEPVLTGTCELILNGKIHTVNTTVRVLSGGQ